MIFAHFGSVSQDLENLLQGQLVASLRRGHKPAAEGQIQFDAIIGVGPDDQFFRHDATERPVVRYEMNNRVNELTRLDDQARLGNIQAVNRVVLEIGSSYFTDHQRARTVVMDPGYVLPPGDGRITLEVYRHIDAGEAEPVVTGQTPVVIAHLGHVLDPDQSTRTRDDREGPGFVGDVTETVHRRHIQNVSTNGLTLGNGDDKWLVVRNPRSAVQRVGKFLDATATGFIRRDEGDLDLTVVVSLRVLVPPQVDGDRGLESTAVDGYDVDVHDFRIAKCSGPYVVKGQASVGHANRVHPNGKGRLRGRHELVDQHVAFGANGVPAVEGDGISRRQFDPVEPVGHHDLPVAGTVLSQHVEVIEGP